MSILNNLETANHRAFQFADKAAITEASQLISSIHALLDGKEWNSDTPGFIADLLADHGLVVNPYDPGD